MGCPGGHPLRILCISSFAYQYTYPEVILLLLWQIIETVLIIILGIILHFLYEWSGKNKFVATFSAVNESTWEHLKLAFFPILIFGIVDFIFVRP